MFDSILNYVFSWNFAPIAALVCFLVAAIAAMLDARRDAAAARTDSMHAFYDFRRTLDRRTHVANERVRRAELDLDVRTAEYHARGDLLIDAAELADAHRADAAKLAAANAAELAAAINARDDAILHDDVRLTAALDWHTRASERADDNAVALARMTTERDALAAELETAYNVLCAERDDAAADAADANDRALIAETELFATRDDATHADAFDAANLDA